MKKFILALVAMVTMTVTSASAMSYEQARQQALFLTDKMAYELNLTDDQYEAAYETNLDLSYILLDWQYRSFLNATYFYRPLYWNAGYWHFGIYARYPHRNYYFFGCPHFYTSYCGGHSWRMNGGRSWYNGRHFGGSRPGGQPRMGMRDGFDRGDFGRGQSFGNQTRRPQMNNNRPQMSNSRPQMNRSFGNRESSTRTTVNNNGSSSFGGNRGGSFGNMNRSNNSFSTPNRSSFGGSTNRTTSAPAKSFTPRSTPSNSGSFGSGSRSSFGGNRSGSSFGGGSHSSGSFGGGFHSNGGGSFGGRR